MEVLLKPVVKALLKACAPVVGSLMVDLTEVGINQWMDGRDKAAAEDLAARLLERIRTYATALAQSEGLSEQQMAVALAHVETIAGTTQHFVAAWGMASFDADRAAVEAMAASRSSLDGLSQGDEGLVLALLKGMFSALASEAKALEATEALFRKGVMSRLDNLGAQLQQLGQSERDSVRRALAAAALSLRVLPWRPDLSPPGALLRADIDDPVPFHGRESELESALSWAAGARSLAVRLYTGSGGIGKTRLLRELVLRLRTQGWQAGFLDASQAPEHSAFWEALIAAPEPRLYVIDYAENRRHSVVRMLQELVAAGCPAPRRVVLLARAGDEWWAQLKREPAGVGELLIGPATERIRLGPVAASIIDRKASYETAARHFALKLNGAPVPTAPNNLENEAYERALLLHMAALAAVEGVEVDGDQGVLGYVLGRERRFWSEHVSQRGLPPYLDRSIGRAMAAVTLAGGARSARQALELLRGIEAFADQQQAVCEAVAQMLHELYPGDRWIEPILPDLLGEHLVQEELADDPQALLGLVLDGDAG